MPNQKLCKHGYAVCNECIYVSDAAKRMSDIVNGLLAFSQPWDIKNKWLAIRLADGGYDGTLYDNRDDAIRHQSDERLCAYICMRSLMTGAKPLDCQIYLDVQRQAYDQGMSFHEPEAPQTIMPIKQYDAFLRHIRGVAPWELKNGR